MSRLEGFLRSYGAVIVVVVLVLLALSVFGRGNDGKLCNVFPHIGMNTQMLPRYAYRLQYLTGDGSGYFDTGVVSADDIGVKSECLCISNSAGSYASAPFGTYGSSNRYGILINNRQRSYWWNTAYGNVFMGANAYLQGVCSLNFLNDRKAIIEGREFALTGTFNPNGIQIRIYDIRGPTGGNPWGTPAAAGDMADVYISKGTRIIRHYIPVMSEFGTVEYYDKISGQYATRTGTFTAGPRK